MKTESLLSATSGSTLVGRCAIADRPWSRMRGLLGRQALAPSEGMLFSHTGSVHTFFMRFPIDVVFLDGDLTVLSVHPSVVPWKTAKQRGARWTLELAAGEAARAGIDPGTALARSG